MNMDFSIVCQIFILIFLDFPSDSSTQGLPKVVESNDTATWEEAWMKCQQKGQLARFLDVSSHSGLQPGEFWFSGVHALSPWVWMRGCFNKTLLKKKSVNTNEHSAGTCALKCYSSPYFALDYLGLCYCLSKREVDTHLNQSMKVSTEHCQLCGNDTRGENEESVFLYQKYQENSLPFENMELESNKDLRCVTMKYNDSYPENTTFLITNCNEKHKGVCITGENGTLSIGPNETWIKILDHCQNNGPGYPFDADKFNQIPGLMQTDRIWIGLYREEAKILDESTIMNANLTTTRCLYIKHADGEVGVPLESDCNVTRRYICTISDEINTMSSTSRFVQGQLNTTKYVFVENPNSPKLSTSLNIYAIVGGCAGAVVLITVVVIVLICIKRSKKSKEKQTENHTEGNLTYSYAGLSTRTLHDQLLTNPRNDVENDYSETFDTDNMARRKRPGDDEYAYTTKDFSDPDRVYVDSQDDEYDVLGKKRQKVEAQDSGKVYGNINDDGVYNVSSYSKEKHTDNDVYDLTRNVPRDENVYDRSETVTSKVKGLVLNDENENTEDDKENVYIDTQEDEYDVLGKKREKVNNEDSGQLYGKIKDDGLYDVSKGSVMTQNDTSVYDTSKGLSDSEGIYDKTEKQLNIQVQSTSVHFNAD